MFFYSLRWHHSIVLIIFLRVRKTFNIHFQEYYPTQFTLVYILVNKLGERKVPDVISFAICQEEDEPLKASLWEYNFLKKYLVCKFCENIDFRISRTKIITILIFADTRIFIESTPCLRVILDQKQWRI